MKGKIFDLNERNKDYKFNLSVVKKDEWDALITYMLLEMSKRERIKSDYSYSVNIKENIATIGLSWNDGEFHEVVRKLDAFGIVGTDYQDFISLCWQYIMSNHYDEEYVMELQAKQSTLAGC